VDDASLVGVLDGFADLNHQGQPLPGVEVVRIGIFDQRLALDELHGEEGLDAEAGVGTAGLVNLRNAGMVQPAQRLRLLFEAAQQFRAGPGCPNDLEGDVASRLVLLGLVHRAHSTFAQQANDAITTDARRQRRG
jgi:hypothetical protein